MKSFESVELGCADESKYSLADAEPKCSEEWLVANEPKCSSAEAKPKCSEEWLVPMNPSVHQPRRSPSAPRIGD